jgi:hypothetical protein
MPFAPQLLLRPLVLLPLLLPLLSVLIYVL